MDVGLAAWLLDIRDAASIQTHAARGALFETYVVSELVKQRFNTGRAHDLYFWRDSQGHEIDVLFESPAGLQTVEIKSGSTFGRSIDPQATLVGVIVIITSKNPHLTGSSGQNKRKTPCCGSKPRRFESKSTFYSSFS